ncbi:MAG TPA: hypothetical protein VMD25_08885 [Acidobacteriaceae bacterium]|nr:hypothetical protein [Acidobacteriaceae bacterium]
MKTLYAVAGALLLACSLAASAEVQSSCVGTLDAPLLPRADLTIHARPAGLEIVGTDKEVLHVTCKTDDPERAQQVHLEFSGGSGSGTLRIEGPPTHHGDLQIRVEVPRRTNLRVDMGAGEVKVEDVAGDKEISLYAGQITISSAHDWDYQRVDASVDIGEVNAAAYHVDKGGFFRSFTRKTDQGEYRLYAHVMTGQIDLVGKAEPAE